MAHLAHFEPECADHRAVDQKIRAFNLVSEPMLDDQAVAELAQAVSFASILGSEALAALTRRESELSFGDLLEPLTPTMAHSRAGIRFEIRLGEDHDVVLGVLFASEAAAVALADVFFGGPGEGVARRLTDIEAHAVSSSIGGVIAPVIGVVTGRERCSVHLQHVKSATLPSDTLVELVTTLIVGGTAIEVSLFVPNPDGTTVDGSSREHMVQRVSEMPVDVEIDLAQVQMGALDVQALSDGDVVVFDAAPDSEATVRSGSTDLLRGRVAEREGRRFLEVTEVLVTT